MALNDWESLSMKERALYIRLAVANGLHTTEDIRLSYNEFKKGGPEETRKLAFLSSLEESLRNNSRYNTPEWRRYLTDLAGRESGYRPNITNSIGAKGYFLLMPFNRATQWTTPTQLFEEMFKMSDANMKWFKKNLTKLDLLKAEELGIDIYGLMAGAHLGGVKGVIRALRGTGNAKDMNGTSVLNYMTSFSLTPRNTSINYTMPVSYPLEVVLLNNYLPFNYTLMDSNEGNIPKNILIVEELPIQKLPSNIIVLEEPYVNPLDIIASVLNTVPSITTYNTPRPLTATEILALREANRNTLLTKEFENSLLRDNLLGIEEDSNLFEGGGNKGRYWVDDDTMLPELLVTPRGNTIVRDEVGNPALTVGAIRDINPNATIYERVNRELKNNQYNTELPQWIVNMNADRYANAVSPGIGDLVTAGLKPMDAMMPSRWVGLLDSDNNKGLLHLFDEDNRGFFIGNDQTKPFSKRYAEEHPLWATAGNLVGDVISSAGATKALQKSANELKTAYNYYTKGEGFPIDLIHNLENTPWYSDLVERYGKEFADETAKQVRTSGFNTYFFGDNPKQARKAMKRYEVQRDIINKISGNPDEGKAVLAGSPAVSNNGYIDRLGAAFHDIDFNAYMRDATKTTKSHPSITMHPELYHKIPLSRERMAQAPIFETIALNFPSFDNYTVNFPSIKGRVLLKLRSEWDKNNITKHLPNPFPSLYREGVFNVSPMYNVSTRGANRTVMTKINGEPIDIFLSDTFIPNDEGILPAEEVLNWKLYFIDKRLNYKLEHGGIGLEPRQKDIDDISNYIPFSKDNPIISTTGSTQYSPLRFKGERLIDFNGLPVVSDVETYPRSREFVPTFMNYNGKFWPLPTKSFGISNISSTSN